MPRVDIWAPGMQEDAEAKFGSLTLRVGSRVEVRKCMGDKVRKRRGEKLPRMGEVIQFTNYQKELEMFDFKDDDTEQRAAAEFRDIVSIDGVTLKDARDAARGPIPVSAVPIIKYSLRVVWRISKSILWMFLIFFGLLIMLGGFAAWTQSGKTSNKSDAGGPQSEQFYGFLNSVTFPLQLVWGGFVFIVQIIAVVGLIIGLNVWNFTITHSTLLAVTGAIAFLAMVIFHCIDEWEWEFSDAPKERKATSWFMGLVMVVFLAFTWQIVAALVPDFTHAVFDTEQRVYAPDDPDRYADPPIIVDVWWKDEPMVFGRIRNDADLARVIAVMNKKRDSQ